jgi:hypothetical protein
MPAYAQRQHLGRPLQSRSPSTGEDERICLTKIEATDIGRPEGNFVRHTIKAVLVATLG